MKCAECSLKNCAKVGQNCTEYDLDTITAKYEGPWRDIMEKAACTEGTFYNTLTRMEETKEF